MNQEAALRDVLKALADMHSTYMLTGSYASNIYGRVRSTFDADLVVSLQRPQLRPLLDSLGSDFYVDVATYEELSEAGGQFNAVHRPSGLKIDFYLPKSAHDQEALGRRRTIRIWGIDVSVIAPEDLILAKLAWAKQGGSARQIEDAQGIYEMQKGEMDLKYLKSKAAALGLNELLALMTRRL